MDAQLPDGFSACAHELLGIDDGFILQRPADGGRHGGAQFRGEIDLADAKLNRLSDHLIRDAAAAVQNQRCADEAGQFFQKIEIQPRLAFIEAMRRADGDGKEVYPRAIKKSTACSGSV